MSAYYFHVHLPEHTPTFTYHCRHPGWDGMHMTTRAISKSRLHLSTPINFDWFQAFLNLKLKGTSRRIYTMGQMDWTSPTIVMDWLVQKTRPLTKRPRVLTKGVQFSFHLLYLQFMQRVPYPTINSWLTRIWLAAEIFLQWGISRVAVFLFWLVPRAR